MKPGIFIIINKLEQIEGERDRFDTVQFALSMDEKGAYLYVKRQDSDGYAILKKEVEVPWFWASQIRQETSAMQLPSFVEAADEGEDTTSVTIGVSPVQTRYQWSGKAPKPWRKLVQMADSIEDMFAEQCGDGDVLTDRRVLSLVAECEVAGIRFAERWQDIMLELEEGSRLSLSREKDNCYDDNAVAVLTEKGERIGYLPRSKNDGIAFLLDNGRNLAARIVSIDHEARNPSMIVHVFFND